MFSRADILRRAARTAPVVLPPVACCVLGWGLSRIFGGGLIGADGEWQVEQAMAGGINDWLSPVMTVVLRQSLFRFFSIAPLVLVQAIVGLYGLFHLARALLRFLYPGAMSPGGEAAIASSIVALLLVPITPLAYFLVYVQSDGWVIPGLAWSAAGWLNLELTRTTTAAPRRRLERSAWWIAAVTGAAWVVLMRHNTVVLVPVFAALAAAAAIHRGRRIAIVAAAITVVLPFAVGKWVGDHYRVERLHPEDQIIALDLVGMCVADEGTRSELPYTNRHILEDRFRELYIPGFVNVFYWYHPADLRPTRLEYVGEVENGVQRYGTRHAELMDDYRRALRNAPGTLVRVKLQAFGSYVENNHFGERWRPTMTLTDRCGKHPTPVKSVLAAFAEVDGAVTDSPRLRPLCTNHLPWLLLNGLFVVVAVVRFRQARRAADQAASRRWAIASLLLLVPSLYYASHVPAIAGHWYRYMYPAALLVQIAMLTLIAGGLVRAIRSWPFNRILERIRAVRQRDRTVTASCVAPVPSSRRRAAAC